VGIDGRLISGLLASSLWSAASLGTPIVPVKGMRRSPAALRPRTSSMSNKSAFNSWARLMGVDEEAHRFYSQAESSSAGSGSKNSGPTRSLPRKTPGCRRPRTSPMGIRRTTGVMPRAMMTSAPRQACSINFDRLVLASCTLD